ncbi:type II toxin-antitoxin system mRNA interferase toxin, RelE/StbE family [Lactobacillus acetotolerans]|uniref:type II toxin-antitoxin system mRNA interferase toxin, RelE/StbE family n=1 Tax=Lactobacillus acetotolerans TaxID=1600 RepID=UPI00076099BF|nr:type II toxin-antitoxin system mRNA interferase toxin, RelE/StbE family [Lactobacillus acetotolerans]
MSHYLFKPRESFIRDIKYLSKIDRSIVFKINDAISILKCGEKLPSEFKDHSLNGLYEGYRELHIRDTPKDFTASESNDVIVIYKIRYSQLVLIGVHAGSHDKLFHGPFSRYNKKINHDD